MFVEIGGSIVNYESEIKFYRNSPTDTEAVVAVVVAIVAGNNNHHLSLYNQDYVMASMLFRV